MGICTFLPYAHVLVLKTLWTTDNANPSEGVYFANALYLPLLTM
jgi:hypothetical protein